MGIEFGLSVLLNLFLGIMILYSFIAIPYDVIRRIFRVQKGLPVTPLKIVAKKMLIHWLIMSAILIPIMFALVYFARTNLDADMFDSINKETLQEILGYPLTSFLVAYAFMAQTKGKWSYSKRKAPNKVLE